MTRVLITGASGYVGQRAVQAFAGDATLAITAVSRHAGQVPRGVKPAMVDWSNVASLAAICRDQDAIIHLAAMNETACEAQPEAALTCNGLSTLRLLRAAADAGVRRFIYLSTIKVFGADPAGAFDETSMPRPHNHYSITHHLAENYVLAAHASRSLEAVVLRLGNVVGAPIKARADAWALIANDLCRQAAVSGVVALRSNGLAWRNFIAMSDVVRGLRHAVTMPTTALDDGLFNLGAARSIRIWDLALLVARRAEALFGKSVATRRQDTKAGAAPIQLDWRIAKLTATGWTPGVSLHDEIDATLKFCRQSFIPAP